MGIPTIVSETERQTDIPKDAPHDAISHCHKDPPKDVEDQPEVMDTGKDQRIVEEEDTLKLVDGNQPIGETTKAVGTDQEIAKNLPIARYQILMGQKSRKRKTPPPQEGESTEGVVKTTGSEESFTSFVFRHKRKFEVFAIKRTHPFSQRTLVLSHMLQASVRGNQMPTSA